LVIAAKPEQLGELGFARTFDQIGIVVSNLDQALDAYTHDLGIEPWVGWMYDEHLLARRSLRGEEGRYTMRLAVHGANPQLELLEPIDGPSIFHEFLDARGPGLHHVAYFVPSFSAAAARLAKLGFPLVQTGGGHGLGGDGVFGYFDAAAALGIYIECIEPPQARRPPHFVYPELRPREAHK
jgi:catechol 2,3-dioxygenase-like lactoylglutathione lyase family enzyme